MNIPLITTTFGLLMTMGITSLILFIKLMNEKKAHKSDSKFYAQLVEAYEKKYVPGYPQN